MTLKSDTIRPFLPAFSNGNIASTPMRSDSPIFPTCLFRSNESASFKLLLLLVMNSNPVVENHFLWTPAQCAVPMRCSSRYLFIGHQILIICMFGTNAFAYEISLQSETPSWCVVYVVIGTGWALSRSRSTGGPPRHFGITA
ncbi:hypothetical protein TNCV_1389391 [Trichonephila clavipes]|nr:hypothetical protein TNCV_1389391 [Trichonephila clavipes]